MQTPWEFSWLWCLLPFLFLALLAIGCAAFMGRQGGCGCAPGNTGGRRGG